MGFQPESFGCQPVSEVGAADLVVAVHAVIFGANTFRLALDTQTREDSA
jgi:hypothetical protein